MIQKGDHFIIAGLGIEFTIIMCLGFFGGRWLDNKFDTSPVFLLLCCAAAFALSIYILVVSAKAAVNKKTVKKETTAEEKK